ncbi:MAG: choice-of-anchor L domain-containing protein [Bacteroidota bacterium]
MTQRFLLPAVVLLMTVSSSFAQLVITPGGGAPTVTSSLGGPGLTISNVTINCDPQSYGSFSNGVTSGLGVTNGFMLSTGNVSQLTGANLNDDFSTCVGTSGSDPQLTAISSSATNDLCVIEFDVVPQCATMSITFVFGSDEYTNWVNQSFNDAFGFFVSGPNPSGGNYTNMNIATIPGGTPVTIDNVSHLTNTAYFVNNDAGTYANSLDGYTVVLTPTINVTPCATYHFKLAIADATDCVVDSAVMIDLIQCTTPWTVATSSTPANCPSNNGTATATVTGGIGPFTYSWNTVPVQTTSTATGLAPGTYTCTVNDGLTCTPSQTVTVTVGTTGSTPTVTVTPAAPTICAGGAGTTLTASGASTYVWAPATGLSATTGTTVTANPAITTTYTVTGTAACGVGSTTVTVTVNPQPTVTVPANATYCAGANVPASNYTSTPAGATYTWTNSNTAIGLAASGTGNTPAFTATNGTGTPITSTITVTPTLAGCPGPASTYTITVNPVPSMTAPANITQCAGTAIPASAYTSNPAGATFAWTNSNTGIGLGASGTGNTPGFTATNGGGTPITGTITVTPTLAGCTGTPVNYTITVNPLPVVTPASNSPVCSGGALNLTVNATTGATYSWTGPNGFTSSAQNPSITNVTTAATGTYTVVVTANGCSTTNTVNVTVNNCCVITNMTANISAPICGSTSGTYNISGQVDFTGAPATGTLTVTSSCGGSQVFNAPFTSPTLYNLNGLNADGAACNVTAVFSANATCTQTIPYTAPICPCNMDSLVVVHGCSATAGMYDVDVHLVFSMPPSTGQLNVTVCGTTQTFNAPFTSPMDLTFTVPATGGACTVSATFTADPACTNSLNFVQLNCVCPANAGNVTANMTGSGTTNYILCENDIIDIITTGYTHPDDEGVIGGFPYAPGIGFLIYSCPPTAGLDPLSDPCFQGVFNVQDNMQDINDMLIINSFPAGTFTNNTVYYAPFTFYNAANLMYDANCWHVGPVTAVTYLDPITSSGVENCAAGSVTVTVSGGYPALLGGNFTGSNLSPANASFSNTTAANGGTITITGLLDGQMYSFDIVDQNGCPHTFTGGPFNGPDVPVITPAGPFCVSDPATTLTSTFPGGTWSGTGITNTTTGAFDPATAGVGIHTIIYTAPGCGSSDSIQINVNTQFDATITPAGPFCESSAPVNLVPAVDPGGTWSGTGITDAVNGTFDPSVAGAGTWTITYTIAGACGDVQTTNIVVNPDADPTITPVPPMCATDPAVNLTAVDPGGTWSGTGITNATAGTFDPASSGLGTFDIVYTIGGMCGADDTIQITVNDQYDATITPAGPFCQSNPSTFLAAVDAGGTWSATCGACVDAVTGQFFPTLATAGNNTITYTIPGACGDTQSITIQVIADADATITQAGPFCVTDPALNLTAAQTGGVWSGTGITSAANGTFDPASASIGPNLITYSISGVCGDADTMTIIVVDLFNSTITPQPDLCVNAAAVTFVGATPGGTWSATCGACINAVTGQFDPAVATPGTYTITYAIPGSCGTTSNTTITVNPLPVVAFSGDVLSGCVPVTTTFTNNTTGTGTATWYIDGVAASNSTTTFTNSFTQAGCYDITLQLTSAAGCTSASTQTDMVCAYDYPVADFTWGPTDATVLNPAINFVNQSQGATSYTWDFAGLGTSTAANPSFTFPNTGAGSYEVCLNVSNAQGCMDSTCQFILIYDEFLVYVPNTFTPDGDGINDIFLPIVSGHDPLSYELMIFNRWGELIFESYFNQTGWDGTHKATASKQDVYVWKLKVKKLNNGELKTYYGHVTLLR